MTDTKKLKEEDAPVGRGFNFRMLRVPDEPPLKYEYWWVESLLFDKKPPSPKLAIHAHKLFEELREQMDGLKAYIEEHKGKYFASRADQLMYGSLLENMRDLLAKLIKAVVGPYAITRNIQEMDDRLAPYLKGISG